MSENITFPYTTYAGGNKGNGVVTTYAIVVLSNYLIENSSIMYNHGDDNKDNIM